jgi:DNA (cytosine-5)-methyltransferase 1
MYTLNTVERHAIAAVDCRNGTENEDVNGTLQAKNDGGYSYNTNNTVREGAIVRRLTPMECERLQGFPDYWTAAGHDKQPITDSKRYSAIGNSVAIPCVDYIMQGIVEAERG